MAQHREAALRFEREAMVSARIVHPHVVNATDSGRLPDGSLYLVLEYVSGHSLRELRDRESPLPPARALAICAQIADALAAAHKAEIVHRDLKPGNVMLLSHDGNPEFVKVLDFGLARVVGSDEVGEPLTRSGSVFGTPEYMSPEQMDGQAVDQRADIFAFGCVLYEMLAGRKAFEGGSPMVVVAAIMNAEPPPIEALRTAPPVVDHLLRRCLEKDPNRRWQSMADVTGEVRWIADQPLTVAAPIAPGRRSWWPIAAAIAVALLAMPLALLAGMRWLRPAEGEVPPVQFEIATTPTERAAVELSPDGRQIAYIANRDGRQMLWRPRVSSRPTGHGLRS